MYEQIHLLAPSVFLICMYRYISTVLRMLQQDSLLLLLFLLWWLGLGLLDGLDQFGMEPLGAGILDGAEDASAQSGAIRLFDAGAKTFRHGEDAARGGRPEARGGREFCDGGGGRRC